MITLTNSKIESEIVSHFEEYFEVSEPKEDYECTFDFDGAEILVPYTVIDGILTYKNEWIGATKNGISYSIEDTNYFKIRRMSQDPKKRTAQQEIESIIEHEERKRDEHKDTEYDHLKGTIIQ